MSNQTPDYSVPYSTPTPLGDTDGDTLPTKKALCIYRNPIAGDVDGDTKQMLPAMPPMSEEETNAFTQLLINTLLPVSYYYSEEYVEEVINEEFPSTES